MDARNRNAHTLATSIVKLRYLAYSGPELGHMWVGGGVGKL